MKKEKEVANLVMIMNVSKSGFNSARTLPLQDKKVLEKARKEIKSSAGIGYKPIKYSKVLAKNPNNNKFKAP